MSNLKRYGFGAITFGIAGLAGPLVRFATWPPSGKWDFVYDLVFYMWPGQLLASDAVGFELEAGVCSIGGNILLFSLVGLVASAVAQLRIGIPSLYAVICGLLVLFGLWGAGFDLTFLRWPPLVTAIALAAIPFWIVMSTQPRSQGRD